VRIVAYTAILGRFPDRLFPPRIVGAEVVAYVDDADAGRRDGWPLRAPAWRTASARRDARRHKLLAHELHPDADYSLWLDGCFTPVLDARELVARHLADHDICVFRHRERNCAYDEGAACARLRKDDPVVIREQLARYAAAGYPRRRGLAETGVVLRRHTAATRRLNEAWWAELEAGSLRDQLSFDYVCWRLGLTYATFARDRLHCPYFRWRPHR
jgi:hypothetical protein